MKFFIAIQLVVSIALFSQDNPWYSQNPLPQSNIYSIKFFDPNNGIGFTDNGIVIKTTNQGYSWQFIQTLFSRNLYASHFINNTTGYCAGDSGLVMKTTNGGNNWSVINTGVTNSLNTLFFTDVNTGFAAGASGMIIKTTNAGLNWQQSIISSKKLIKIFFTSSNIGFAGGDTSTVFKTTNGGLSWTPQFVGPYNILDIYFMDASTGFIRTQLSIFKTSDGGNLWIQVYGMSTIYQNSSINFLNSSTGYAVTENSPMLKTTNGGINWINFGPSNIFPYFKFYAIDVLDTHNIFISGNGGFIFRVSNSSWVWEHIGGNKSNYSNFTFLNAADGIIYSGNYVLNTTNGGDKWFIKSYGDNNWFEPNTTEFIKIVSKNGMLMKVTRFRPGCCPVYDETAGFSPDGGLNWTHQQNGGYYVSISDIAIAEDYGMAIFQSTLKRTITGGTWSTIYSPPSGSAIEKVSFHNNNTGMLLQRTGNIYSLPKTTDGGQSWNSQRSIVNNKLNSIQLLSTGTGIILCDTTTILRTADFSSSWSVRYQNGPVKLRTVSMLDDNNGYGLSTTNMFIRTSDGGLNWSQHNTGSTKRLNAVHFLDLNTGYIVGDSGTILKTSNGGLTFINPHFNNTPEVFSLSQNYPNPFNPATNIEYQIPKSGFVKIIIYDLLGNEITQLVNQQLQPGSYNVDWDASNYPSGVYFYKLEAEGFVDSKKMVLVK